VAEVAQLSLALRELLLEPEEPAAVVMDQKTHLMEMVKTELLTVAAAVVVQVMNQVRQLPEMVARVL
jgi:hypothetical protein